MMGINGIPIIRQGLINRNGISMNILVNTIMVIIHFGLAVFGEYLQASVQSGRITYQPIMGHLSDYAGAAAFVSLTYLTGSCLMYFFYSNVTQEYKKIYNRFQNSLVILFLFSWTVLEFTLPSPKNTFDPIDILVYWIGGYIAFFIHNKFNN
jgi:hypothetical protein